MATEYLYRNVVITSTKQMVCLFRSVCLNPTLCRHPHYLANLVPLLDAGLQEDIEREVFTHFPDLLATEAGPTGVLQLRGQLNELHMPARRLWTNEIMRQLCE